MIWKVANQIQKLVPFLILIVLLFASCANNQSNCMESAVGFAPFEGQQVMLGSQETVDVFNQIDAAWAAKDWELLASFVADEATLTFENGKTAWSSSIWSSVSGLLLRARQQTFIL